MVGYHLVLVCGIVTTLYVVECCHLSMHEHVFMWQRFRAGSYVHQQRYAHVVMITSIAFVGAHQCVLLMPVEHGTMFDVFVLQSF